MFPLNPSVGDIYENYEFNGVAWKFIGYEKINDYAPKDSPAITGVASLPAQTTIGVVNKNEIEKLYGFSGQIASTEYVQDQISTTLAGLTGGSVTFVQPTIDTPSGTVLMFGGLAAPFGYLLCDGTAINRTSYADLFAVIGTLYGSGNGFTTFNLPNLKGRIPVGLDPTQATLDTIGETGGTGTHQHAAANTGDGGSHSHNTTDHSHNTADHSHYSDHSHYADHSHNATHDHSISGGSHAHGITGSVTANNTAVGRASSGNTSTNFQLGGHAHTDNFAVSTDSAHAHNVVAYNGGTSNANGAGITTGNSNYGNTGGANAGNTTSGASDGNVTSNQVNHSHTISVSDSVSNIPPYIVLNYIIKT